VLLSGVAYGPDDPTPTPVPSSKPTPDPLVHAILVTNSACNTVTEYPIGGAGNIAPTFAQTGLCNPTGIAVDASKNVYITNSGQTEGFSSITEYAAGSNGDTPPINTIMGPHTGLDLPTGLAVSGGNIYVTNNGSDHGDPDSITIYTAGGNGDVAPIATISGSNTQLNSPKGVAVDGNGNIYVVNQASNTVTIYAAGSNGNVAPSSAISGFDTGLGSPISIALDNNANIYVGNSGIFSGSEVTEYATGSSGDTAPLGFAFTDLNTPSGLAVDGAGHLYVSDQINSQVETYVPVEGSNFAFAGSIPAFNPIAIALDTNANIYVAESGDDFGDVDTARVFKAGSIEEFSTIMGGLTFLAEPLGVAVDANGNVYVANGESNTVTKYGSGLSGDVRPVSAISGPNTGLDDPLAIALDSNGNIYVGSIDDGIRVYAVGSLGNVSPIATIQGPDTGLNDLEALAVDANGNIYSANSDDTITVYAKGSNGDASPMATIGGSNTGLNFPLGMAVDGNGNIYVVNNGNEVTVYSSGSNGNVSPTTTIAGTNTQLSEADGITVDVNGNIYVANFSSNTVTEYAEGSNGNANPIFVFDRTLNVQSPSAVATDQNGNLYIADDLFDSLNELGFDAIVKIGTTHLPVVLSTIAGPPAQQGEPTAITLDSSNNIYVANSGNDSVTIYPESSGAAVTPANTISAPSEPSGMAFDSNDNLYLTSVEDDEVDILEPGDFSEIALIRGDSTQLGGPAGIALDSNDNVYIANTSGSFPNAVGDSITIYPAGSSGNIAPIAVISGANTGLAFPSGIALDGNGNIYVSNKANDSITIYAAGSNGNVAPMATISGSNTGLDTPSAIALDSTGIIYVTNEGGFEGDGDSVTVYSAGSNGNVSPGLTIAGPATQLARPQGIAVLP
jgi:tripartite motif-containing protein 71